MNNNISMGKFADSWEGNGRKTKNITLCVTEDCNLCCKYCYMVGKNKKKKMTFDMAKKCVDYFLNNRELFDEEAVVWEFIGGEPLLEMDLIDKICDYIKIQMYIKKHPWFEAYRFSFSTNGILYDTKKVQDYLEKNKNHVSMGISIDGNKKKHDQQRIYPNGKGSYDDVKRNINLWLKQFPGSSTKATFTHEDIPYLKDSIISLWNLGIKDVAANVVFEDIWHDGDDIILEEQLDELGEYILENELWKDYSVRFFDYSIGFPLKEEDLDRNFCGAGKMIAIDCEGNFFPCIRFLDFSMNNKKGRKIGDINNGINTTLLKPFLTLKSKYISNEECLKCEVATGCAWCTGFNYDNSKNDSIYDRATFNCKMHKATVKSNKKFWDKYEKKTGEISLRKLYRLKDSKKYLQIILDDSIDAFCDYHNNLPKGTRNLMSQEMFDKATKMAINNGFIPVLMGKNREINRDFLNKNKIPFIQIIDNYEKLIEKDDIIIYKNNFSKENIKKIFNCIYIVDKEYIDNICSNIDFLSNYSNRINLIIRDKELLDKESLSKYKTQLNMIQDIISNKNDKNLEINIATDILNLKKPCSCDSGKHTFTLAPNGKIYVCPAFYYDDEMNYIGSLDDGIENINKKELKLYDSLHFPQCEKCDVYHCKRCTFKNKKTTYECNTPSDEQCIIGKMEREIAMQNH
ncbi:radical SAM peptide maturase, CXXX-repeat target family [Clostridium senegalense]|uniref:radical SAM peptide maturase, CXXX-repeat target family n=1 Tax=Clostridium senegalense TaxID=1465809 RepID=UPI001C122994|nr:radical SAM peptide maturase, CXXX-repeat target family [Clostridium senegalense]MBU5227112.1 radical SAM peptide maturase, CXXX-repeat target family [Clostridium senegalense]